MKKLFGVVAAMTTPFTADGMVDVGALKEQVAYLINGGVNCLYPCGTTGEMHLCSIEERKLIAETVVSQVNGRIPVFIHTGAMDTESTIKLSRHACEIGADGIGVVTPAYFSMSERAIIQYYKDVCSSVPADFPVYVYVIPQLAKNDISPETMQKICDTCPNVVGVKYSYPDMTRLMQYVKVNNGQFSVLFGADHMFLSALIAGADGVVSGCAGAMPEPFADVYEKYIEGDINSAKTSQKLATELAWAMKSGADMSIFKHILAKKGIGGNYMRRPLLDLTENEWTEISAVLENCLKGTKYSL